MNQTTWIVGGGVAIVALALVLYFLSGDSMPRTITPEITLNDEIMIDTTTITGGDESLPEDSAVPVSATPAAAPTPTPMTEVASETVKAPQVEMVMLKTSMGDITVKLYGTDAPNAVANFVKLAGDGFYNGVRFHRVIKGFMIQGGDPLSKDDTMQARWGTGGPGYKFDDEINAGSAIYQRGYKKGVLAMANSGANTNGSQFFIMHADYPLPPLYVIFGEVTEGLDVVEKIGNVATDENDRPLTPVTILSAQAK